MISLVAFHRSFKSLFSRQTKLVRFLLLAIMPLFLVGCELSRIESQVSPGRSVGNIRSVYVEKLEGEDWGFHQQIADGFASYGYRASSGEIGQAPKDIDAIVNYHDRWFWDITPYLLELDIRLLDPKDRTVIAWVKNRRTSMVRYTPYKMATEAIYALKHAPLKRVNDSAQSNGGSAQR